MLAPEVKEQIVGLAAVRNVFRSSKFGTVAGCMVIDGYVRRNFPIRVLRNNVVIFEGALESLKSARTSLTSSLKPLQGFQGALEMTTLLRSTRIGKVPAPRSRRSPCSPRPCRTCSIEDVADRSKSHDCSLTSGASMPVSTALMSSMAS